ncbi:MAG TPA: cytochrome C oxidase subunit I, partial [Burkholderiaceae bacterium]|nr:cytochrome C oxidase subunit I [Burkholderiaceae bacterium]
MNTLAHTWPRQAATFLGDAPADGVRYTISLPVGAQRTLARGWLWLAMAALIGSGLFSLLLVLSRTPGVNR